MKLSDLVPGAVFRLKASPDQKWFKAPWNDCAPLSRRGILSADPGNMGPDAEVELMWSPDGGPSDPVKNPAHYARLNPQPIDVIRNWGLNFQLGSALKYIARAGHKTGADDVEDLRKAIQNLQFEIEHRLGGK